MAALQHVFIADIACFDRITNSASTITAKSAPVRSIWAARINRPNWSVQNALCHDRLPDDHWFRYFHFQLRFAFVLERR